MPAIDPEHAGLGVPPFGVSRPAVLRTLDRFLTAIVRGVQQRLSGKHACLKIALTAVVLSLLITFPLYEVGPEFQNPTGQALLWKVQHPLSPVPAQLKSPALYQRSAAGGASHADKLELRLTLPILGWLSRTGRWTVLVWNHLAAFGTFYLLASLALAALGDSTGSALFVLGLAPTFFGAWFFNDFMVGDGVAYFLMLLSVACRLPALAAFSFLAAAFCDERCVLAAPLLILYLAVRYRQPGQRSQRNRLCAAIVAGALAWAILRWWLGQTFHLSMGTTGLMSREILHYHLTSSLPGPFLEVFKASWTLPVLALLVLVAYRSWGLMAALLSAFALAIAPAFMVWDFSRSVAYTFVVLLISLYFLNGDREISRKYLAAILVVNVLLSPPYRSILRIVGWALPHTAR